LSEDEAFRHAVDAVYTTFSAFGSGDASPFAALWSQRDDVTIFGAFGAYERGWADVDPRLAWAARRIAGSQTTQTTYEPLAAGMSGDLGYAVGLERSEVRLLGQDDTRPGVLRVTHLFRREDGAWRIIHRHADPRGDSAT
jgi:ketosteroid isomerase-like protein